MGEDFRPIPVPENSVLNCGVGSRRRLLSGDNFQQTFSHQPEFLFLSPRGSVQ